MADTPIKFGALCWNQDTDWPSLLEAGRYADRLGYDSLWTWDHVYPIVGTDRGPMYEGWLTITAWAQATTHATVGLMVGREHVPRAVARREDGDDARSHQPRPRGARARRRMVRDRASSLRLPVRLGRARATALAGRGAAGACAACSAARSRRRRGPRYTAQRVRNDPLPLQRPAADPRRAAAARR